MTEDEQILYVAFHMHWKIEDVYSLTYSEMADIYKFFNNNYPLQMLVSAYMGVNKDKNNREIINEQNPLKLNMVEKLKIEELLLERKKRYGK